MYTYNIIVGEHTELQEGLSYLQSELKFQIKEDGFPVTFCKAGEETAVSVKKDANGACITYGRMVGAFHGFFLLVAHQGEVCYEVEENCCFKDFGAMIDMSRNAVMKVDAVKQMLVKLAMMGYESVQVYTEDTLKVAAEEYMGYGRGAYYREEIQEMDRFAQMFGIELIPCIECLAHLNQLCLYSRYSLMMDCGDILMVGEPRTYEFIEHIFQMIAESYTSRKVNVGMDEASMLGRGGYLEKNGYRPRAELMAEHTEKVNEIAKKYGFQTSMWSDMFYSLMFKENRTEKEDEILNGLPKDVRLIYWDYGTTDYDACASKMENHLRITENVAFAGGSWKWWGLVPNNQHGIFTQEVAIRACKEKGIQNYLLTCWGDNGAEASNFSVLPCFFAVSRMSYVRKAAEGTCDHDWTKMTQDEQAAYAREFYTLTGMEWDDFMKIECINRLNMDPEVVPFNNANKYFFYNDPIKGMFDSLAKQEYKEIYAQHAKTLAEVKKNSGNYYYLFDSIQKMAEVLEVKCCLGIDIRAAYEAKDNEELLNIAYETIPEIVERIDAFYEAFMTQWHTDNKSFGFDVQCIRIGGVKQRLCYVQDQLIAYANGEIKEIAELEEAPLPFGQYLGHKDANKLYFNDWKQSVTPCCI